MKPALPPLSEWLNIRTADNSSTGIRCVRQQTFELTQTVVPVKGHLIDMTTSKIKTKNRNRSGNSVTRTQTNKKKPVTTKVKTTKKNTQRQRIGKKKSDGTEISAPSAEGIPGVETEPTSANNDRTIIEKVTPQRDGILDVSPSTPSSPRGTPEESDEVEVLAAMARENKRKLWKARIFSSYRFEKFRGFDGGEFYLLFSRAEIFVSADYVARAATYGDELGPEMRYTVAEIIETLNSRQLIVVPSPEIPANSDGAVRGAYIALEVLCSMLHDGRLADESDYFADLSDEFERGLMANLRAVRQEKWNQDANRRRDQDECEWHQEQTQRKAALRIWKAILRMRYAKLLWAKLGLE